MFFSRQSAEISGSGSTAPVLTEPPVPTTKNGTEPPARSPSIARLKRRHVHPKVGACLDPPDRVRAYARDVRRLLDPRVRFGGSIDHQLSPVDAADTIRANVPACACGPRREQADDIGHVAAADEQAAAARGISNQLGDPADGLRFDLGRGRRQSPRTDVRVQGGGQEVRKDSDRSWRRRDVAEEPRMCVEERVVGELPGQVGEECRRIDSLFRQRPVQVECFSNRRRGFVRRH